MFAIPISVSYSEPMKQSISFVTFAVRDFSRELAFYRKSLGGSPSMSSRIRSPSSMWAV